MVNDSVLYDPYEEQLVSELERLREEYRQAVAEHESVLDRTSLMDSGQALELLKDARALMSEAARRYHEADRALREHRLGRRARTA